MPGHSKISRLAAGEIEILETLWRKGSATIAETHEAMARNVGYTTVQTRLNRLVAKGLARKSGSHPARYEAAIKPEQVCRGDLDVLVESVTSGRIVPLVAHLVQDRELSDAEIRELKQLISEAERANRKPKSKGGNR
jgi:BlaI family transcriptional regulator, penicillinase repressor